jgi:hypothetical protein
VAISQIERWQSAQLKGGNQSKSKGFAEVIAKMHSADFKRQKDIQGASGIVARFGTQI